MKRLRLLRVLGALVPVLTVLFSAGNVSAVTGSSMVSMMNLKMAPTQCQASCVSHSSNTVVGLGSDTKREKDKEPQPAEPYYLAFMGVGWTTAITIAVAYLIKYLRWRPPDLYKLNVAYRF